MEFLRVYRALKSDWAIGIIKNICGGVSPYLNYWNFRKDKAAYPQDKENSSLLPWRLDSRIVNSSELSPLKFPHKPSILFISDGDGYMSIFIR